MELQMQVDEKMKSKLSSMTKYLKEKTSNLSSVEWTEFTTRRARFYRSDEELKRLLSRMKGLNEARDSMTSQHERSIKKLSIVIAIAVVLNWIFEITKGETFYVFMLGAIVCLMYMHIIKTIEERAYVTELLILQEVERKYRAENGIMGIRSPRYKERYEELLEKRQSAESVDEDEETLIQKLYEGEVDVAILNGMNSRVYYEVDEA
jgi:hypothetical protein